MSLSPIPSTGIVETQAHSVAGEVVASAIGVLHEGYEIVLDVGPDAAGISCARWSVPDWRCVLLGRSASGAVGRVEAAHDAFVCCGAVVPSCL